LAAGQPGEAIWGAAAMTDYSDLGFLIARVCLSAVYLFSAIDKLTHRHDSIAELQALKLPSPALLRPLVIAVQAIGGLMVLLGIHTGLGAAMLLAFTALATLLAHRPFDHQGPARRMQFTIALEHVAICGGLLLLTFVGPGRYSFDAALR
jgi:putative oxidoreductase